MTPAQQKLVMTQKELEALVMIAASPPFRISNYTSKRWNKIHHKTATSLREKGLATGNPYLRITDAGLRALKDSPDD